METIADILDEIRKFGMIATIVPDVSFVNAFLMLGKIAIQVAADNKVMPQDVGMLDHKTPLSENARQLLEVYRLLKQSILNSRRAICV